MQERPNQSAPQGPKVDVTPALGEADHEVEALGFEGIPDTGPVLGVHDDHAADMAREHLDAALAQFPID